VRETHQIIPVPNFPRPQLSLDDDEIWKLCTAPGTPETWSILRRKVPNSAFDFLNHQAEWRINYGTGEAKAFFHKKFMQGGLRTSAETVSTNRSFDSDALGTDMEGWLRYLFHDGKIEALMSKGFYWNYTDRKEGLKKLKDVEFSCTFPFTHGSSLAVNTALLIADSSGLVPFTDSQLHHNMLVAKFQRIIAPPSKSKPLISGIRQLHPEKLRRVALTLLNVMVPEEIIDNMSIADCIKYRDASAESFLRLKVFIGDLASQIESEPMTEKFEQDMQKLIHQKVIPEAQKVKDKGIRVYWHHDVSYFFWFHFLSSGYHMRSCQQLVMI
jgi:hypothetical protein